MRGFDVFFDLRFKKRLSKQSRRRWFETPSRLLWRHCKDSMGGQMWSVCYDLKVVYICDMWTVVLCNHASGAISGRYCDGIMSALASQITGLTTQPFMQVQIKENIKAPRHWPLCVEFTGDRWSPRTNGHWRGKCFHLMTSSWTVCGWIYSRWCQQQSFYEIIFA